MAKPIDFVPPADLVRSGSLRDAVAEALEQAILTGRLKPGDRLVERKLAKVFHVSPIPVREALQELESRRLVVVRRNQGASVVSLGKEDIRHANELRQLLEPNVIRWATQRITPQ